MYIRKIGLTAGIVLLGISGMYCKSEKSSDLPNILWLSTEDIGPEIGCYGDPNATTPVLDELASRGILYTQAFANAPEERLISPEDVTLPPYFPGTPIVKELWARYYNNITACDMWVEEMLDQLEEDLKNSDEWVRLYAAQVLDELGETSRPAENELEGLMKDHNKYVVRVANHALNQLRGTYNDVR